MTKEETLVCLGITAQFMAATMALYMLDAPRHSFRNALRDAAVIVGTLNMALLEPR
jgi:hypothetical protein